MANKSLKEILVEKGENYYQTIKDYQITLDDVKDFYFLYQQIMQLEDKYNELIVGRKEAAQFLCDKLELLEEMSKFIAERMERKNNHYGKCRNTIVFSENADKVLEILLHLANDEGEHYDAQRIWYTSYQNSERHGYRDTNETSSSFILLTHKEALKEYNKSQRFSFKEKLQKISQKYSMILIGLTEDTINQLNIPETQKFGIYMYQFALCPKEDELTKSAKAFIDFIKENGSDFDQMKLEDLVEIIKLKYKNRIKTPSYVSSNDSEVIANLIDGFEYDPSKTDEILAEYKDLDKTTGPIKGLRPKNK